MTATEELSAAATVDGSDRRAQACPGVDQDQAKGPEGSESL